MNKYDLEKRTLEFSKNLICLVKNIKRLIYNEKIIRQLIASSTSIGANYREANGAESRKDFQHKIRISLKETRETKYWLKLLQVTNPEIIDQIEKLHKEAHEFSLIFGKICVSLKEN